MSEPDHDLESFKRAINDQMKRFESDRMEIEAKNMLELVKQTDIYSDKHETYLNDYKKEYPILRRTWEIQLETIIEIWKELKKNNEYGNHNTKIDEANKCKNNISEKITRKRSELYGTQPESDSKKLDESKIAYDKAIQQFKTLTTLGQAIKTRQVEINKWIDKIKEICFCDIGFAIYLFWDKVFHAHRDLIEDINNLTFNAETESRYPKDMLSNEALYRAHVGPRMGPWLIKPGQYLETLDTAYLEAYKTRLNDEFEKRKKVDTLKTELDALLKTQKDWTDKFDDKVKSALQGKLKCPVQPPSQEEQAKLGDCGEPKTKAKTAD